MAGAFGLVRVGFGLFERKGEIRNVCCLGCVLCGVWEEESPG